MPARDIYHNAVKAALIADGWTITDDPYWVKFGGKDVYIDLGAERDTLDPVLAAERGTARIAVEIKTFTGPSIIVDLEQALASTCCTRAGCAEPSRSDSCTWRLTPKLPARSSTQSSVRASPKMLGFD